MASVRLGSKPKYKKLTIEEYNALPDAIKEMYNKSRTLKAEYRGCLVCGGNRAKGYQYCVECRRKKYKEWYNPENKKRWNKTDYENYGEQRRNSEIERQKKKKFSVLTGIRRK